MLLFPRFDLLQAMQGYAYQLFYLHFALGPLPGCIESGNGPPQIQGCQRNGAPTKDFCIDQTTTCHNLQSACPRTHELSSKLLKGGFIGEYKGLLSGDIKGDTRSLDYDSHDSPQGCKPRPRCCRQWLNGLVPPVTLLRLLI